MNPPLPKKMLGIMILDILKKYSGEKYRLSQKEIGDILEKDYGMRVDRKAIKRNLMNLLDYGYDINYDEIERENKNGERETLYTGWYINRGFTDPELRLIIDSLLFSKHIPHVQCKDLINKIGDLSNKYFSLKTKHISGLYENRLENKELFYTIEILDEAISKGKQVSFLYNKYDIDKKMHPQLDDSGAPREYIINPYQMVATNGRYYLICNYDKYEDVANYRLDRITNIKLLKSPIKPMRRVKGLEYGLNLPKHMAEHIYMFAGESGWVTFRAKRYLVTEIIDWFGPELRFSDISQEEITVRVYVNLHAMHCWALQYAAHTRLLSPQSLVDRIKMDLSDAARKYED